MSETTDNARLCLKVMVNKEKTKVLFAEADSDFVSVLLSFLLLPLGRIVKLLEKQFPDNPPVFGSITSLYKSLTNLDDVHFSTPAAKLMLLDPPSSSDSVLAKLKVGVFKDSPPAKYFVCGSWLFFCDRKNMCMYYSGSAKCDCGSPLNSEVVGRDSADTTVGVFTIENASFIISDDLKMMPNSAGFFHTLRNFGDMVAEGAQLRNLSLGSNEIMDLVKCCLLSKTPLTDFLLNKGEIISSSAPYPGIFLHQIEQPTDAYKIILKVMVHKSTNRVLFAEAKDDFIELLSTFLIIPIAGVESLFDANACLNNLDNLYRSISDASVDKYFISPQTKQRLINPNIHHSLKSQNPFLPLKYGNAPKQIYTRDSKLLGLAFTFKSPKGEGNHVKGQTTYLVTDDLAVAPFYISSTLSILNNLNISLTDVVEQEVHIGLQEV